MRQKYKVYLATYIGLHYLVAVEQFVCSFTRVVSSFNIALPLKVYQFLVGLFALLGSLLFSYNLGVIAQVISAKSFISKFNLTNNETGAVVSVFTGGAFFGARVAGPIGDILSRRMTIMIGALVRDLCSFLHLEVYI